MKYKTWKAFVITSILLFFVIRIMNYFQIDVFYDAITIFDFVVTLISLIGTLTVQFNFYRIKYDHKNLFQPYVVEHKLKVVSIWYDVKRFSSLVDALEFKEHLKQESEIIDKLNE